MRKIKKLIQSTLFLFLVSLFCLCFTNEVKAAEEIGTATIAVEKFTIGQGYLIEPCIVPIYQGDTCATILDRILKDNDYVYMNQGTLTDSFYLSSIKNADSGSLRIPAAIRNMDVYVEGATTIYPPTNSATNMEYPDLSEFSYNTMSGWMYSVNGKMPEVSMSGYQIKNGDVMRVQFTVYGYGADLGSSYQGSGVSALTIADKDELTKKIAEINRKKDDWMAVEGFEDIYDNAMSVLENLTVTQKKVDNALSQLNGEELIYPTSISLKESLTLEIHDSYQLIPSMKPEKANQRRIYYTSANDKVVMVDNKGNLIPKGVGEADVTAETANGLTAVCHVTIYKEPVPLTGVSVSDKKINRGTGESLTVTTIPEDADSPYTLSYKSSDPAVVSIDKNGMRQSENR